MAGHRKSHQGGFAAPRPGRSLAERFPDVAAEWHPKRNGALRPSDVSAMSSCKAWWKCRRNPSHEWFAVVANRSRGSGCPLCRVFPESRQEIYLRYELALLLPIDLDLRAVELREGPVFADMLAPALRLAIEFDGSHWHRARAGKDEWKNAALASLGWRVVRVREHPLKPISDDDVVVPHNASSKDAADIVLLHVSDLLDLDLPGLDEYLACDEAQNVAAAERYLDELLRQTSVAHVGRRRGAVVLPWDEAFSALSDMHPRKDTSRCLAITWMRKMASGSANG